MLGVYGTVSLVSKRSAHKAFLLPLSILLAVGFLPPARPAAGFTAPPRTSEAIVASSVLSRSAGVRPTRSPSLRHLELLQVEVALAGLLRSRVDVSTRADLLARSGVFGSDDLRRVALDTREAALLLQMSPSAADPALQVVQRARRLVSLLFPSAPSGLSSSQLAVLLDAAATGHDRLALRTAHDAMSRMVEDGVFRSHVLPPKDLHPFATLAGEASWSSFEVLLRRHDFLRLEHRAALEDLAARTLGAFEGSGGLPSVSELASVWSTIGFRRLSALTAGLDQLGDRYRFGSRGPDSFDCSGLTSFAWDFAGVYLKTFSFSQRAQTDRVLRAGDLLPGDLVFYERPSRTGDGLSGHVAIYLGWSDLILEANQGAGKVRVARIDTDPLWGFGQVRLAEERVASVQF